MIAKPIPSSGEKIPVIGMGTWSTFDVGNSSSPRAPLKEVLRIFFTNGGSLIDSSPMYGRSERVLGDLLSEMNPSPSLFSATKVWTRGKREGIEQMEESTRLWRIQRFDLMQVHNLVDWEKHLETLREWKASNRIRYIGITTSHGSRHAEMERVMLSAPIDFIQLTYNIADRSAEDRLLPLAQDRGIAVIANRPFDGGSLFRRVKRTALPPFAAECDCTTWAQLFLKFIVSHPAVTCAIPATSKPEHIADYMNSLNGRLPDAKMRERIARIR